MKLFQISISLVLSTLILSSSLRVSITYAYYELDPIGFIEKLCENKDKPELQCNGKCQLKKVTDTNTENQKTPFTYSSLKEITLFVVNKIKFDFIKLNTRLKNQFEYNNLYAFLCIDKIDRPPKVNISPLFGRS